MVRTHVIMMDPYCSGPLNSQQRLRTIVFSARGSSGTAGTGMDRLSELAWIGSSGTPILNSRKSKKSIHDSFGGSARPVRTKTDGSQPLLEVERATAV